MPFELLRLGGAVREWLSAPELLPSVRCALEFALHFRLLARATGGGAIADALVSAAGRTATRPGGETHPGRPAVQSHVRLNGLMARGEAATAEEAARLRELLPPLTSTASLACELGSSRSVAANPRQRARA